MDEARLAVVPNDAEAELLCGMLRLEGIECYFRKTNYGAGSTDGMLSSFGPTEIVVGAGDLEQARGLLGLGDDGCG